MKIEFRNADGGDIIVVKQSEELKDNILKIFVAEPSFYQIKQNRIFKGSYIK